MDDDAAIRKALEEVLSSEGYDVRLAENGVQALEVMRSSTPPDVVVLDLMMPVMSGWEVILAADEDAALRSIPIVVASAMAAPVASRDRRGGVRKCLSKPLDVSLLIDTLRRVTAPRAAECSDLRSAVNVRDDFLSSASHELKTPLTALQRQVQLLHRILLRATALEPAEVVCMPSIRTLERKVSVINRQVTRLTALVDTLLDASSLTNCPMTLSRETVDLKELITSVLARSEDVIRESGSAISVRSETVSGSWDRSRIESVATNLILNAVKFGEGRPIEIEVDHPGNAARLVVRDHGIGIASAEQERVFGKFERAAPLENYGGLGLGLWIAQQAIAAHGGHIHCESRPGAGSTFTVDLPRLPEVSA